MILFPLHIRLDLFIFDLWSKTKLGLSTLLFFLALYYCVFLSINFLLLINVLSCYCSLLVLLFFFYLCYLYISGGSIKWTYLSPSSSLVILFLSSLFLLYLSLSYLFSSSGYACHVIFLLHIVFFSYLYFLSMEHDITLSPFSILGTLRVLSLSFSRLLKRERIKGRRRFNLASL